MDQNQKKPLGVKDYLRIFRENKFLLSDSQKRTIQKLNDANEDATTYRELEEDNWYKLSFNFKENSRFPHPNKFICYDLDFHNEEMTEFQKWSLAILTKMQQDRDKKYFQNVFYMSKRGKPSFHFFFKPFEEKVFRRIKQGLYKGQESFNLFLMQCEIKASQKQDIIVWTGSEQEWEYYNWDLSYDQLSPVPWFFLLVGNFANPKLNIFNKKDMSLQDFLYSFRGAKHGAHRHTHFFVFFKAFWNAYRPYFHAINLDPGTLLSEVFDFFNRFILGEPLDWNEVKTIINKLEEEDSREDDDYPFIIHRKNGSAIVSLEKFANYFLQKYEMRNYENNYFIYYDGTKRWVNADEALIDDFKGINSGRSFIKFLIKGEFDECRGGLGSKIADYDLTDTRLQNIIEIIRNQTKCYDAENYEEDWKFHIRLENCVLTYDAQKRSFVALDDESQEDWKRIFTINFFNIMYNKQMLEQYDWNKPYVESTGKATSGANGDENVNSVRCLWRKGHRIMDYLYNLFLYYNDDGSVNYEETHKKVMAVQEMCGCFLTNVPVRKIFFNYNNGGGGKSTFVNVITKALGEDNYGRLSFEQIANDFMLQTLKDKLANFSDEAPKTLNFSEAKFKSLISNEIISTNVKFQEPIAWKCRATLVANTNHFPLKFDDFTQADLDRIYVFKFDHQYHKQRDENKNIVNELIASRGDREFFFLFCLQGLQRLIQNKFKLTETRDNNEFLIQILTDNDFVFKWLLSEGYIKNVKSVNSFEPSESFLDLIQKYTKDEVYTKFQNWMKANSGTEYDYSRKFPERLKEYFPRLQIRSFENDEDSNVIRSKENAKFSFIKYDNRKDPKIEFAGDEPESTRHLDLNRTTWDDDDFEDSELSETKKG